MADISFAGSIPQSYDQGMGEVLFEPYAIETADRVRGLGKDWLEIAAGTGRLTKHLAEALPEDGSLIATDLQEPMLDIARGRVSDSRVTFRQSDALNLPFEENSFDLVVAQFGVMFYPDKLQGHREARRVLRDVGTYVFSVWKGLDSNPYAAEVQAFIEAEFAEDPPTFYKIPFGYHDVDEIRETLTLAGFSQIAAEEVDKPFIAPTAASFARGAILGNPLQTEITSRGLDPEPFVSKLAQRFADRFGDHPVRTELSAVLFTAR